MRTLPYGVIGVGLTALLASAALAEQHDLVRNRATFQIDSSTLTPLVYQGLINVVRDEPDNVSSLFAANAAAMFEVELIQTASDPRQFRYATSDLNSIDELAALIPYGEYELTLTTTDGIDLFATLFDPAPQFTNVPRFLNFDQFSTYDPRAPFTVEWDAMAGGNSLALQIFGPDGFYYVQHPGIDATSAVIPADTLDPGKRYVFSLVFASVTVVDTDGFDGDSIGQVFYQHFTEAEFITIPEPSAIVPLAVAGLAAARRRR